METIDMVVIAEPVAPLSGGYIVPVPNELTAHLVPARWIVHEWRDYWYTNAAAQVVRVGSLEFRQQPEGSENYPIRFENQLGLASLRAFAADGQQIELHHVDVVASKFALPDQSVALTPVGVGRRRTPLERLRPERVWHNLSIYILLYKVSIIIRRLSGCSFGGGECL